jgi:2-keto-4-pentenoate hydratase/2-oxohepta-3-ene-1,7-dioic acid hydratase in catechol pathway
MPDAMQKIRDLSSLVPDIDYRSFSPELFDMLRSQDPERLPLVEGPVRLGPPIGRPGKIVAFGLNYVDHVAESGLPTPDEPAFFLKPASAVNGPGDDVMIPRGATQVDWEDELAAVIHRRGVNLDEGEALAHVGAFTILNDVSERHSQFHRGAGQWVKGKAADTFAPLGPYLVTSDEIVNPHRLAIWLELNGQRIQDSTTAKMVFSVAKLVSYASEFMSLEPGDVVATGTPAGVGMGMRPPRYLRPGDTMRLGIDGLGVQEQSVVSYTAPKGTGHRASEGKWNSG